jgi:death-on-curing protein
VNTGVCGIPYSVVLAIIEREGIAPVRDEGLLQSALDRPHTTLMGHPAYPSTAQKAAALLHSVCLNHALVDGNERLAAILALAFLDLNGASFEMTNDQLFELVMDVASGQLRDVDAIAARLHVVKR